MIISPVIPYMHSQSFCDWYPNVLHAVLQMYKESVAFKLAAQPTGDLLKLQVVNTTYIPLPISVSTATSPDAATADLPLMRYMELHAATARTWVCSNTSRSTMLREQDMLANGPYTYGFVEVSEAEAVERMAVDKFADCRLYTSFVLADLRWQLQAQVLVSGIGTAVVLRRLQMLGLLQNCRGCA